MFRRALADHSVRPGRPINPTTAPSMRCPQLAGADLAAFKKQVAASAAERERESRL